MHLTALFFIQQGANVYAAFGGRLAESNKNDVHKKIIVSIILYF